MRETMPVGTHEMCRSARVAGEPSSSRPERKGGRQTVPSHKYMDGPYSVRTDRVVYLVEPERAWGQAF